SSLGLLFVCYSNIELSSSRKVLRSSGFTFIDEWASVISGSDEGIYAWVIANYALDSLGGDPLQTTGIVELGGASAQVAFVSSEVVPPEFSRTISYGGVAYKIYSHSFLHYGQDTAQEDLYESLQNSGYMAGEKSLNGSFGNSAEESRFTATVQAAGNFSQCRSLTAMLQKGKGKNHYRYIIPRVNCLPLLNFFSL
ncbi:probable apyrase 5, partial [Brassica rapa]|uniref:probable apyrase 5 n=1 Tax=Brassica campestris TaxID=3711 RepID=UPI00142DCA03